MEGIDVPFDKVGQLSPEEVYAHVKRAFLKHRKADAIYLLGTGWRVLPVIDLLEQDLGVPVVHPVPARCWEIQHRLSIRQPVAGFGRLLAEMVQGWIADQVKDIVILGGPNGAGKTTAAQVLVPRRLSDPGVRQRPMGKSRAGGRGLAGCAAITFPESTWL